MHGVLNLRSRMKSACGEALRHVALAHLVVDEGVVRRRGSSARPAPAPLPGRKRPAAARIPPRSASRRPRRSPASAPRRAPRRLPGSGPCPTARIAWFFTTMPMTFSPGMSCAVSTASTPSSRLAAAVSMRRMRACGMLPSAGPCRRADGRRCNRRRTSPARSLCRGHPRAARPCR